MRLIPRGQRSCHRGASPLDTLGSPLRPRESESRKGLGPDPRRLDAALSIRAYGSAHLGQMANTWRAPGETKRRAAVNQRPAGSKWMSSGSPHDRIVRTQNVVRVLRAGPRDRFELADRLVNSERTVGTLLRPDPTAQGESRSPSGPSTSKQPESLVGRQPQPPLLKDNCVQFAWCRRRWSRANPAH